MPNTVGWWAISIAATWVGIYADINSRGDSGLASVIVFGCWVLALASFFIGVAALWSIT